MYKYARTFFFHKYALKHCHACFKVLITMNIEIHMEPTIYPH